MNSKRKSSNWRTQATALLNALRKEAVQRCIAIPFLTHEQRDGFDIVKDGDKVVWRGKAANGIEAKAHATRKLLEQ